MSKYQIVKIQQLSKKARKLSTEYTIDSYCVYIDGQPVYVDIDKDIDVLRIIAKISGMWILYLVAPCVHFLHKINVKKFNKSEYMKI